MPIAIVQEAPPTQYFFERVDVVIIRLVERVVALLLHSSFRLREFHIRKHVPPVKPALDQRIHHVRRRAAGLDAGPHNIRYVALPLI